MILREEGPKGFFRGVVPSYWGISENAVHFVLYERLKKLILEQAVALSAYLSHFR